jgi:serpin B
VDEEGTEAAAVTIAGCFGSRGSRESPPPFEMIVNRPFLFAIDNVNLPGPLFLGRVEDPSKNR